MPFISNILTIPSHAAVNANNQWWKDYLNYKRMVEGYGGRIINESFTKSIFQSLK